MKEEWDTSEGRMEIFSPSQRGMDLTTGNATNAKSMTQSSQSKLCAHKATGLYNFISLVVYFRDLSPEPALECEEELSPSPDQGASRLTSRAKSRPPPNPTEKFHIKALFFWRMHLAKTWAKMHSGSLLLLVHKNSMF